MSHASTPLSGGLARVTADRAAKWRHAVPHARRGEMRGVHHVRTTSRRLREALRLASDVAPDAGAHRLGREVKRVARACGPLRDADACLETFRREVQHGAFHPGAVACVQRALTADRDHALESLPLQLDGIDLDRWTTKAKALKHALDVAHGSAAIDRALARRLRQRAADVRRALDAAGTLYSPERLHRTRIVVKKLRYLEELAHALGAHAPGLSAMFRRVQRELGRLQDLHVLEQRIRAIEPETADPSLVEGLTAIADAIERDARARHARFLRQAGALRDAVRAATRDLTPLGTRRPMIKMPAQAATRPRRRRTA